MDFIISSIVLWHLSNILLSCMELSKNIEFYLFKFLEGNCVQPKMLPLIFSIGKLMRLMLSTLSYFHLAFGLLHPSDFSIFYIIK